ncbi:MAG: SDR family oxidoreductase [Phycisphaerae bacterium]|jgi:3-oxoacyl-[acyl-carrier protein] reductase
MASKTCVITGASRGIGLATALRFARQGMNVVAAARGAEGLEHAAESIRSAGGTCEAVVADVAQAADAARLIVRARERFGRVDVLVNNAGCAVLKPLPELSHEDFDDQLAVNVGGVFHVTQAAWPVMVEQGGGVIVNVSSLSSVDPFRGFSVYGACKAWVNLFTQAAASEGKDVGIRVYAVAPGAVETGLLRNIFPDLPAAHLLEPEQVAEVITSLCEERLSPCSGQTFFVRK